MASNMNLNVSIDLGFPQLVTAPKPFTWQAAHLTGKNTITSIAFSRDGKSLVSADDRVVRIWDSFKGDQTASFTAHDTPINTVASSSDKQTLATGAEENRVKLWNVSSKKLLAELNGHDGWINSLAFGPKGNTLASGGDDTSVRLWDVSPQKTIAILKQHKQFVMGVAFKPDGKTLVSGDLGGVVHLWDISSGKPAATLSHNEEAVRAIALAEKQDHLLLSGTLEGTLSVWDLRKNQKLWSTETDLSIMTVAIHPKGDLIACGGPDDHDVHLYRWSISPKPKHAGLKWHKDGLLALAFDPDGDIIASAGKDKMIRQWDLSGYLNPQYNELWNDLDSLSSSSSSKGHSEIFKGHTGWVKGVAVSSDQSLVISCGGDNTIRLWEPQTAEAMGEIPSKGRVSSNIACQPGHSRLAWGNSNGSIELYHCPSKRSTVLSGGHSGGIECVAFNPAGEVLASSSEEGRLCLWKIGSEKPTRSLDLPESVLSLAFSPDRNTLALGTSSYNIHLVNATTLQEQQVLSGHSSIVKTIAFSSDGKLLASGSGLGDRTIRIWDLKTGKERICFKGRSALSQVVFCQDGKTLASAGSKIVRLWDIATGKERAALKGHTDDVTSLALSSDGKRLISGSRDKTVRQWDMDRYL